MTRKDTPDRPLDPGSRASGPVPYASKGELGGLLSDDLLRLAHRRLVATRERRPGAGVIEPDDELRRRVRELIPALAFEPEAACLPDAQDQLSALEAHADAFVELMVGDVMALGPLGPLLADHAVTEIMVNGPKAVFYERGGATRAYSRTFLDELHLRMVAARLLESAGRTLDPRTPIVEALLKDGARLEVIQPPVSLEGLSLALRKIPDIPLDLAGLVSRGMLSPSMCQFLEACVRARVNIVVAGGSGTGRSTLLNALAAAIPAEDRVIVIEDVPALQLSSPNRVRLQTQPADAGTPAISMRDLVKIALRMRPTRIILGECRGPEAIDMLLAMSSGHDGSMMTAHASAPREALVRLQTLAHMSGLNLSETAMLRQVGSAVDLVVQCERVSDGARRVTSLTAVQWVDGRDAPVALTDIFVYQAGAKGSAGTFRATGAQPFFQARLEQAGVDLPPGVYQAP